MTATDPTYYLFAGKLFRAVAFATEPGGGPPHRAEDASSAPAQPRCGEDPGAEGPAGEPVGGDDDDATERPAPTSEPSEAPPSRRDGGLPFVNDSPDANPIDPRVFSRAGESETPMTKAKRATP